MKKIAIILLGVLVGSSLNAQDITGQWQGILKVQGLELRLAFNIMQSDSGLVSTMDSPDQGASGIPVQSTHFEDATLKIEIPNLGISYTGTLNQDNAIVGEFKQSGMSFPLNLSKEKIEKKPVVRLQEPQKPYPYIAEEVKFLNADANIHLAGTLTLPSKEGVFPAVILITGSGAQNRDEELLGHKPFLVLADYLTRNGIAVLRYDDRGTAESEGDFKTATSLDFAQDVRAALNYLQSRKEIDKKKIGLIGHSEGGLIAPMVAANSKDVGFIVLLAGPGIPGADIILLQEELISKVYGLSDSTIEKSKKLNEGAFAIVGRSESLGKIKSDLDAYLRQNLKDNPDELPKGMNEDEFISRQVNQLTSPWMRFFLTYDPVSALEKVKCPVLALNGSKDLQVPPKVDLDAISKALKKAGNKRATIKEIPNLNHLFQECETGAPNEYFKIEQTFSPIALKEISDWILKF